MRHQLFGVCRRIRGRYRSVEIFLNTSFAIGFSFQPIEDFLAEALIIHLLFVEIRFHILCPEFEFFLPVSSLWEKLVALFNGAIVSDCIIHFPSKKEANHYLWLLRRQLFAHEIQEAHWGPSDEEDEDQYPYEDYE
jgi:hypothetical protein